MTIEEDAVKIEINCQRKDCPNTFILDTEKWPPQRYCSKGCSQLVRTRKWRATKKTPPDATSGIPPFEPPEPHGDTPAS